MTARYAATKIRTVKVFFTLKKKTAVVFKLYPNFELRGTADKDNAETPSRRSLVRLHECVSNFHGVTGYSAKNVVLDIARCTEEYEDAVEYVG